MAFFLQSVNVVSSINEKPEIIRHSFFINRVQTPGYVPKKTHQFFWVHPPKKPTPKKPTLLLLPNFSLYFICH